MSAFKPFPSRKRPAQDDESSEDDDCNVVYEEDVDKRRADLLRRLDFKTSGPAKLVNPWSMPFGLPVGPPTNRNAAGSVQEAEAQHASYDGSQEALLDQGDHELGGPAAAVDRDGGTGQPALPAELQRCFSAVSARGLGAGGGGSAPAGGDTGSGGAARAGVATGAVAQMDQLLRDLQRSTEGAATGRGRHNLALTAPVAVCRDPVAQLDGDQEADFSFATLHPPTQAVAAAPVGTRAAADADAVDDAAGRAGVISARALAPQGRPPLSPLPARLGPIPGRGAGPNVSGGPGSWLFPLCGPAASGRRGAAPSSGGGKKARFVIRDTPPAAASATPGLESGRGAGPARDWSACTPSQRGDARDTGGDGAGLVPYEGTNVGAAEVREAQGSAAAAASSSSPAPGRTSGNVGGLAALLGSGPPPCTDRPRAQRTPGGLTRIVPPSSRKANQQQQQLPRQPLPPGTSRTPACATGAAPAPHETTFPPSFMTPARRPRASDGTGRGGGGGILLAMTPAGPQVDNTPGTFTVAPASATEGHLESAGGPQQPPSITPQPAARLPPSAPGTAATAGRPTGGPASLHALLARPRSGASPGTTVTPGGHLDGAITPVAAGRGNSGALPATAPGGQVPPGHNSHQSGIGSRVDPPQQPDGQCLPASQQQLQPQHPLSQAYQQHPQYRRRQSGNTLEIMDQQASMRREFLQGLGPPAPVPMGGLTGLGSGSGSARRGGAGGGAGGAGGLAGRLQGVLAHLKKVQDREAEAVASGRVPAPTAGSLLLEVSCRAREAHLTKAACLVRRVYDKDGGQVEVDKPGTHSQALHPGPQPPDPGGEAVRVVEGARVHVFLDAKRSDWGIETGTCLLVLPPYKVLCAAPDSALGESNHQPDQREPTQPGGVERRGETLVVLAHLVRRAEGVT